MSFQFNTRTLLLATTCIAIVLASQIAWFRTVVPTAELAVVTETGWIVMITSPVWSRLVWGAYAIGRRQLTVAFVVALAVFEVVISAAAVLAYKSR